MLRVGQEAQPVVLLPLAISCVCCLPLPLGPCDMEQPLQSFLTCTAFVLCATLLQLKAKLAKLRTQLQEPAGKVGALHSLACLSCLLCMSSHTAEPECCPVPASPLTAAGHTGKSQPCTCACLPSCITQWSRITLWSCLSMCGLHHHVRRARSSCRAAPLARGLRCRSMAMAAWRSLASPRVRPAAAVLCW